MKHLETVSGRGGLARGVITPTLYQAITRDSTSVKSACVYALKIAGWRGGLTQLVITPALHGATAGDPTCV